MKQFCVTFRWYDTNTFCTNICFADSEDAVREHYGKYSDVSIRLAFDVEVEMAKKKGMPVITL